MAKVLDRILKRASEKDASDLHIKSDFPPVARIHGDIVPIIPKPISRENVRKMIYEAMKSDQIRDFEENLEIDLAYETEDSIRVRANIFHQNGGISGAFRFIPSKVITAEKLGLPESVINLTHFRKGLVLVTGPTGSGKSTTLAALIDHINSTRNGHIITIEDPIEFIHGTKKCLINQRQLGSHTKSFAAALRAALREDPDVILVGEMRDLETTQMALHAAETGHLVFSTLHTTGATKTVDRIIDAFPAEQQSQVRTMLSETIKGVVSQILLKRSDGSGRCAALEIMVVTPACANMIREGKTYQLLSVIQTGKSYGMQTLDQSLLELVNKEMVSREDAYVVSEDKRGFS